MNDDHNTVANTGFVLDGRTADRQWNGPAGFHNGADSFTYVANDGQTDSATATVTITVNGVNDGPIAEDDDFVVANLDNSDY